MNFRLVINLYTQLCQVEHSLYEPKFKSNMPLSLSQLNDKWKSLQYLLLKMENIKKAMKTNELTRSEAHMYKIVWFKAYSIHGRKYVTDIFFNQYLIIIQIVTVKKRFIIFRY